MRHSILTWTKVLGCVFASIALVSEATATSLTVNAFALHPNAGDAHVAIQQTCTINVSFGTPCADDELVASTNVVRLGSDFGFAAAGTFLTTGQIKAYVAARGSFFIAHGTASASIQELVNMDLAPGASWPQSFTVRLIADGTFSGPHTGSAGGTSYWGSFRDSGLNGLNVDQTLLTTSLILPTVDAETISISAPTDLSVFANLQVNTTDVTINFSTRILDGIRFEVELPPGLVMTSQSGVFLTENPQDEPPILPPAPPPGSPEWRMPVRLCDGLPCARRYDPPVVLGYEYEAIGGTFMTVELPTDIGDGIYDIEVFDDLAGEFIFLQSLLGGEPLIFELDAVDRFRVLGIEAEAGLDPTDTEAFVTTLAFTGPVTELVMTPIESSSVPLLSPWSIGVLATILVSLGVWLRSGRLASV